MTQRNKELKVIVIFLVFYVANCSIPYIVAGYSHTCALSDNTAIKCWGGNYHGRLGYGDAINRGNNANEMGDYLPQVDLGVNFNVTQIVAGGYHTCALSDNNAIKCWGDNSDGQLGYGDAINRGDDANEMGDYLLQVDLGVNFNVTQIVAGRHHTCALSDNNAIKCWGYNWYGRLGYGDTINRGDNANEMGDYLPQVDLGVNFNAIQIVAGGYNTCALSDNNAIKCWGYNWYGQLGYGDAMNRGDDANDMGDYLPQVDLGVNFNAIQIVAGGYHTCALSDNNAIKCWGDNSDGELGYGDTINRGDNANEMGDNLLTIEVTFSTAESESNSTFNLTTTTESESKSTSLLATTTEEYSPQKWCNLTTAECEYTEFTYEQDIFCCSYVLETNTIIISQSELFKSVKLVRDLNIASLSMDWFFVIMVGLVYGYFQYNGHPFESIKHVLICMTVLGSVLDVCLTFSIVGIINENDLVGTLDSLYEQHCYSSTMDHVLFDLSSQFETIMILDVVEGVVDIVSLGILFIGKFATDGVNNCSEGIHAFMFLFFDVLIITINVSMFVIPSYNTFESTYDNEEYSCFKKTFV